MLRRFPHWLAAGRWAVSVRTARFRGGLEFHESILGDGAP